MWVALLFSQRVGLVSMTHIDWRVLRVLQKRKLSDWLAKILANQKIYIFFVPVEYVGIPDVCRSIQLNEFKMSGGKTTLANIGPLERPDRQFPEFCA